MVLDGNRYNLRKNKKKSKSQNSECEVHQFGTKNSGRPKCKVKKMNQF